jgi:hypothetical protein
MSKASEEGLGLGLQLANVNIRNIENIENIFIVQKGYFSSRQQQLI